MRSFFVITGGPGSGKTSLIDALRREGFSTMLEAGRAIIQDQVEIGGSASPWADRAAFAEMMLGWELRSWREARALRGPVIFDRGVPDVIGYLKLCGLPIPQTTRRAAELRRYNRLVFLAPFWPEIFARDAERKQSPEEAERTFRVMAAIYADLGYESAASPLADIEERAAFVRLRVEAAL